MEYSQRGGSAPSVWVPGNTISPVSLLQILARQVEQTLPLDDLMRLSQMDPDRFRGALKSLVDEGYVEIQGPPLEEIVRSTDSEVKVARLARPA